MAIKDLRETFVNLKRLREIVAVLHRHGFDTVLFRAGLDRWLGLSAKVAAGAEGEDARSGAAERLAAALEELGAMYIKFGQALASRPDILPPEYVRALSRLQDKVEPLPYETMREVLAAALPRPADAVFAAFDPQPVASGSIGQVYHAVLRSGEEVMVKLRRPGTAERMEEDLSLLRFLARVIEGKLPEAAPFSPRLLVDEFARGLQNELNFLNEAAYAEKFSRLDGGGRGPGLRVPRVYWELSGREVLVEERLPGRTLASYLEDLAAGKEDAAAAAALADILANSFLEQYFVRGFFHSDPHPGNLLVMEDGTLGLVDFGQVGQLPPETQRCCVGLLAALGRGDTTTAAELCCQLGVAGEDGNPGEFRGELGTFLNRFYGVPFNRLRLGEVINEAVAIARRHGMALPRDLALLVKSLATLQGVVCRLAPGFRLNEAVPPFVKRAVAGWFAPGNLAWGGATYLYRMFGLLRRLPEEINALLRQAGGGKIRIIFHHEGLETVGDQVERASNRITLGLLVAAILLGSSIVLASPLKMEFSLPLVGTVSLSGLIAGAGYLAAMGLGFWLAWAILRGKRL